MLSLKFVRENPDAIKADLKKRQDKEKLKWVDEVLDLDEKWRQLLQESEKMRARRNELTQEVNKLKKEGKDAGKVLKEVKKVPEKIAKIEEEQNSLKKDIDYRLMRLPNILHESVSVGTGEEDNEKLREWGKPTKQGFAPKSHVDIMEQLDLCDTDRAGKTSGSRFYFLKNDLVRLDLALQSFATDFMANKGYTPIMPPAMLRKKAYEGVTDLKDFENMMYRIESRDEAQENETFSGRKNSEAVFSETQKEEDTLYLIATSEHAIAAMHMDEIFEGKHLPLKYAGVSPCYRREAGSHGKDTKGIFRVHQFNKVEQFIFCKEEESWKLFDELLKNVEEIYKKLELPYRMMNMCTAEIGSVAAKKIDLELWMPAQKKYREVVSCSNCTDYQANRLNIRYRHKEGNRNVHTINSTAIATTRTIVAILENFQQKDGSVIIPKVLQPYMNGQKKIDAKR